MDKRANWERDKILEAEDCKPPVAFGLLEKGRKWANGLPPHPSPTAKETALLQAAQH